MKDMTFTNNWSGLLIELINGNDLSRDDSISVMNAVMTGEVSPIEIAGFLVALKAKGESVEEILGFRDAILRNAVPINLSKKSLDIVGTGGDRHGTVNISTMAAIALAATGVPIVKHGNRAASSKSGSSDVIAALGVNLDMPPKQIEDTFRQINIAFLFAAKFHPGFRHVAEPRRDLGIPTVFNILGPLCNPVQPFASAVGVADPARANLIADIFAKRGATALVFWGEDGLDELTTTGESQILEVSQGTVVQHSFDAEKLGLARARIEELVGGDATHNAHIAHGLFEGETGPVRDIVLLNAAAGLTAFQLAKDPQQILSPIDERIANNIPVIANAIDSGQARKLLSEWVRLSNSA